MPKASPRKNSKAHPKCFLAKFQSHLIEKILRQFQIVSYPSSNCILSRIIQDNSILCLSQIPIASPQKVSETIPKCVLAKFQLHLLANILKHFQILS